MLAGTGSAVCAKDADSEIGGGGGHEYIPEIFEAHGEAHFRGGERRVIERLLAELPHIPEGTERGRSVSAETRSPIKLTACSVWLNVEIKDGARAGQQTTRQSAARRTQATRRKS